MIILRRLRPHAPTLGLSIAVVMSSASLIGTAARATEPVPISWRDDYGGALEEARAANRPVWIQFTGPWCPNCVRMERNSYPDADVIDHAQRSYVPLKLRSDVHEQLALGFNLTGLPATVLIAPTREIITVHQGYLGPDELDQLLSDGLTTWRSREATAKNDKSRADRAGRDGKDSGIAKDEPKPELAGYCPVSLVADRKLVQGKAEHAVQHEGRTYRFASAAKRDQFRKDPERFIPANRGECPVARLDDEAGKSGDPRCGVLFQGRLYLCSSAEARRQFLGQPDRYAAVDVAEQGFCPHCIGESGLLVRGDPQYSLSRDGLRYWFPDTTHRDAFIAASPKASEASTSGAASATTRR